MKKNYIAPELDVVLLESADIITASVAGGEVSNEGGWDTDDWG